MKDLSYFFYWDKIPAGLHENFMWEFTENGASFLTLPWQLLKQFHRQETSEKDFRMKMERCSLKIINAHGPYGRGYCINPSDENCRKENLAAQLECMSIASSLGAAVYVLHLESGPYLDKPQSMDQLVRQSTGSAVRSLEILLPHAEKMGLTLAVENCFSPQNTADQVISCISRFNSPRLGCCFDSGHANLITPGKVVSRYSSYLRSQVWRDHFVPDDSPLDKLAPHIVTCHLHDNDGYNDLHDLPGTGTIRWDVLLRRLSECPRLLSMQAEILMFQNRISICRLCKTFNAVMKIAGSKNKDQAELPL